MLLRLSRSYLERESIGARRRGHGGASRDGVFVPGQLA